MELQAVTMAKPQAREKFLEYQKAVRQRHTIEDEQIMRGYKALAQGKQVISLVETIRAGGLDEKKYPKLAVCRADVKWCWFRAWETGSARYSTVEYPASNATRQFILLPDGSLPGINTFYQSRRALVPVVPPALRPKTALSNYHVLWEADWKMAPPRDPALLKRIGGDLWAVLATWDLTEIERLVLSGRR